MELRPESCRNAAQDIQCKDGLAVDRCQIKVTVVKHCAAPSVGPLRAAAVQRHNASCCCVVSLWRKQRV